MKACKLHEKQPSDLTDVDQQRVRAHVNCNCIFRSVKDIFHVHFLEVNKSIVNLTAGRSIPSNVPSWMVQWCMQDSASNFAESRTRMRKRIEKGAEESGFATTDLEASNVKYIHARQLTRFDAPVLQIASIQSKISTSELRTASP